MPPELQHYIFAYMSAILRNMGHFPIIVGGVEDHVHILMGYNINQNIPDLVRELKTATSKMINGSGKIPYTFAWQRGYAVFSYSHSHIDRVASYISNQAEHHRRRSFREELSEIYKQYDVVYDERYAFDI